MDRATDAWGSGLLGVIIFSGSLPATRVAVGDFSPLFLTSARAVIAAVLGAALLVVLRQEKPGRRDLGAFAVVGPGVVIGFPLLKALALEHIASARSIVFIGLLPLATAIFGVLRGDERPRPAFRLFSGLGSATVAGFALFNSGAGSLTGDLLMVAAILLCGAGYAEGARLGVLEGHSGPGVARARLRFHLQHAGWLRFLVSRPRTWRHCGRWAAATATPFFGLALAGLLLHEPVAWTMIAATGAVVPCVAGARKFTS
jgi:drug/metabolite transporter (DMT)-like permease